MKNIVGIIGWPVEHSFSPSIHNHWFSLLEMDNWSYVYLPVNRFPYIRLKEALLGLRAMSFVGANVTVPYKEAVLPYLEGFSEEAQKIQAVNTIKVNQGGSLKGYNTDGEGFLADIKDKGISLDTKEVLLLGAGGSAKAVAHAVLTQNIKSLTIVNRTIEKAQNLKVNLKSLFPEKQIDSAALQTATFRTQGLADVVINCTSLGLGDKESEIPWDESIGFKPSQVVYDLIYSSKETPLLKLAKKNGAQSYNGFGMLVQQAALSFKIWTGITPPVEEIFKIKDLQKFGID